jgi:Fe-S-cluster-containing hydrogenase component 2
VIPTPRPFDSLIQGQWFKLICGASFQHLPDIRNLVLVYTLVGADCVDVAPDPAVIAAARAGMMAAQVLQRQLGLAPLPDLPLLMASLNDGEDPHFRKASFDPVLCPVDCPRPCVNSCPAQAIAFDDLQSGIIRDRCYGCGRCLPICPIQHITTESHPATPATLLPLLATGQIDALEIHTQVGREQDFQRLWQAIVPYQKDLKLLAISCADGEGLIDYLWQLWSQIAPLNCPLIWQTDGRPMSGDIGEGATRATLKLGQKVLAAGLPGHVQLAGGTNRSTVAKLRALGLLKPPVLNTVLTSSHPYIAGVAYGSYARTLLAPLQTQLETQSLYQFEDAPALLQQAIDLAFSLISPLKLSPTRPSWLNPPLVVSI